MTDERRSPLQRAQDAVLRDEIHALRNDLTQHMRDEEPLLRVVEGLGPLDEVRVRIEFVNMMMAREKRRQELHDAIVKGTVIAGLIAVATFVGHAIVVYTSEVLDAIRAAKKLKP